jgi:hypothetical protein
LRVLRSLGRRHPNGGRRPVNESVPGVIELLLDRMIAGDWSGYGALVSPDVERIGP